MAVADEGSTEGAPGMVTVMRGHGDGSFTNCATLPAEAGTIAVALGDFNGDKKDDLLALNSRAERVSEWFGDGDCGFTARPLIPTGTAPLGLAAGDLDGDGNLDFVTADSNADTVSVFFGRGDGTFRPRLSFATGTAPNGVWIMDLNGDDVPDLVATNARSQDVSILLGDGSGSFLPTRNFVAGAEPEDVAFADMDDDGRQDVIALIGGVTGASVLRNLGGGSFLGVEDIAAGNGPSTTAVGDVDNDALPDLIVGNDSGDVLVFDAVGDGSFRAPRATHLGGRLVAVAAADFNGDGVIDVAGADTDNSVVAVVLGTGGGAFGQVRTYPTASRRPESRPATSTATGARTWRSPRSDPRDRYRSSLAQAGGTFAAAKNTMVEETPLGIGTGDFNGDGRDDIVVANQASQTVSVLRSTGGGNFALAQTIPANDNNQGPLAVAVTDYNRDGKPDFIVTNTSGKISVFTGNGDATFTAVAYENLGSPAAEYPSAIVVRDFTGDGLVDLAVLNQTSNSVRVFIGRERRALQERQHQGRHGEPHAGVDRRCGFRRRRPLRRGDGQQRRQRLQRLHLVELRPRLRLLLTVSAGSCPAWRRCAATATTTGCLGRRPGRRDRRGRGRRRQGGRGHRHEGLPGIARGSTPTATDGSTRRTAWPWRRASSAELDRGRRARLASDLRGAMRARDMQRVYVLRGVIAAIKNLKVEKQVAELPEADLVAVLRKELSRRVEAIQYAREGRARRHGGAEQAEKAVLEQYLPAQLGEAQLEELIRKLSAELGATQIGPLMAELRKRHGGQYDGKLASEIIQKLSQS